MGVLVLGFGDCVVLISNLGCICELMDFCDIVCKNGVIIIVMIVSGLFLVSVGYIYIFIDYG